MGSSFDARRAGMKLAAAAISASSSAAATSVDGSYGFSPNSSELTPRPATSDSAAPGNDADREQASGFPHDHGDYLSACRAQRQTYADFVASPRLARQDASDDLRAGLATPGARPVDRLDDPFERAAGGDRRDNQAQTRRQVPRRHRALGR